MRRINSYHPQQQQRQRKQQQQQQVPSNIIERKSNDYKSVLVFFSLLITAMTSTATSIPFRRDLVMASDSSYEDYDDDVVNHDRCSRHEYYAELCFGSHISWVTRAQLTELLTETHRYVLPVHSNQETQDDVYQALIDLDRGGSSSSSVDGGAAAAADDGIVNNNNTNSTVRLVYGDTEVPSTPHANPFSWSIEHLWPLERGSAYAEDGVAVTDVHHVKPADSSVLRTKEQELGQYPLFGSCLDYANDGSYDAEAFGNTSYGCTTPAGGADTANDTQRDTNNAWLPPASQRGDIARALLYMDMRYESLSLEDCDGLLSGSRSTMGYLSQLLQWHIDDPPDEEERRRNHRACSRWQGNRNPFIDFPEIVEYLYGEPEKEEITIATQQRIEWPQQSITTNVTANMEQIDQLLPTITSTKTLARTYPSCSRVPTAPPTLPSNLCSRSLHPGDIPFFFVNSDDPDEILFYSLTDIPGGIELFLTDEPWNGQEFLTTESDGTISMVVPEEGIEVGIFFGYSPNSVPLRERWSPVDGDFSLETIIPDEDVFGDNLFLYCLDVYGEPNFISGLSYGGEGGGGGGGFSSGVSNSSDDGDDDATMFRNEYHWMPSGLSGEDYGIHGSALPGQLRNAGALYLTSLTNNNLYDGPLSGTVFDVRYAFTDPTNWIGYNDQRFFLTNRTDAPTSSPTLSPSSSVTLLLATNNNEPVATTTTTARSSSLTARTSSYHYLPAETTISMASPSSSPPSLSVFATTTRNGSTNANIRFMVMATNTVFVTALLTRAMQVF